MSNLRLSLLAALTFSFMSLLLKGQENFIYPDVGTIAYRVTGTNDGGFATVGQKLTLDLYGPGMIQGHLIKFDEQGSIEWEHFYDEFQSAKFIHQAESGHYILGVQYGNVYLDEGWDISDYSMGLVELDETGTVLWQQYYNLGSDSIHTFIEDGVMTEQGYMLAGTSYQNSISYTYIVHADWEGNVIWEKSYETAGGYGRTQAITTLPGNQAAFSRNFVDSKQEIVMIDMEGNVLSNIVLDVAEYERVLDLTTNAVGEIIGVGTRSFYFYDESCFDEYTGEYGCYVWQSGGWYFKIGVDESIVWEHELDDNNLYAITALNDSTYVIVGTEPTWAAFFCFGPCHNVRYSIIDDSLGLKSCSRTVHITGEFSGDTPHDAVPFGDNEFVICGLAGGSDVIGYESAFVLKDSNCTATIPDGMTPLPIELATFYGEALPEGNRLYWTTLSEIDNDHFSVLRSSDGHHFEEIGRIAGAGNSHTAQNYELLDPQPFAFITYYQLQFVDFMGNVETTQTISVQREQNHGASIFTAHPNPFQNTLTISQVQPTGAATYTLYDILGKIVDTGTFSTTTHVLDMESLADVVYFIFFKNGDGEQTLRVVKE